MKKYDPKDIEPKWQKYWEKNKTFEVTEDKNRKKFYPLIEFPYPSAVGLHVGHPRPFTAMDVVARKRRMEGFNVLYPIGFDAFGLPTENYAIKTGRPPAEITAENVANFTRQLKALGYSFAWDRVVNTTDPKYFKWTQWQFLQFFKHGLAYKKNQPINWCPKDKIGLANEEVVNGSCERCGTPVEKRNKEQWMLAITKYADKLLEGLKDVDYITPARVQQENWIGKSEGAEITFKLRMVPGQEDDKHSVTVFTTRPDTLFGVTFLAISADLAKKWIDVGWQPARTASPASNASRSDAGWQSDAGGASEGIVAYINKTLEEQKKATNRDEEPEKTGVNTGVVAVNPANGAEVPVWVTNYVLPGYGTGAIMAVPGHDERDYEFAKQYNLPIKVVVIPATDSRPSESLDEKIAFYTDITLKEGGYHRDGKSVNSDFINGLATPEAKEKITAWLEEKKLGVRKVNYKLRDWVFSRQRYWGEPIPLVHCESCAKKKLKVVVIHGIGGSSKENWFPWLKTTLEKDGHEVYVPDLPNTDKPDMNEWVSALEKLPLKSGDDVVVVGHSLGAPVACQFIANKNIPIRKLVLVAPTGSHQNETSWANLRAAGLDSEGVSFISKFNNTPIDFKKLKSLIKETVLYFSDNDPYIPFSVQEDYAGLSGRVKMFSGHGHFNAAAGFKQLPVVLGDILDGEVANPGWIPLPESQLPLTLPKVAKYEPTDNGESPLSALEDWVKTTCPNCGGPARRETDTMPNWAGSSWYFLRYCDPNNDAEVASKEKLEYWMNVDWYNGGMEHTVLHLLYSRFWNQFMYDIGVVTTSEPYKKRTSHGLIMGTDGEKMSKSRGNVVNPDEMVDRFGADALRTYIMFMGPFDQPVAWDTNGLVGVRRFIDRVWSLQEKVRDKSLLGEGREGLANGRGEPTPNPAQAGSRIDSVLHQTIKKVGDDIEKMSFNTAVSAMMTLTNEFMKEETISPISYRVLIQLLSPFAPHVSEELWEKYGDGKPLAYSAWPQFNAELAKESTLTVAVQVNGKVRDELQVPADITEAEIKQLVLASEKVQKWLDGKEPKKIIYVKGKLVSVVV